MDTSTVKLIDEYDIIIDCTDCVKTRYLINDYSVYYKKKFILASVLKWDGQIYTFNGSGCYRCLYPVPRSGSANCSEAGVMGTMCGVVGSVQSTEAIKGAVGIENSQLIVYNGLNQDYKCIKLRGIRKGCIVCSGGEVVEEVSKSVECPNIDLLKFIQWSEYFHKSDEYTLVDIRPEALFELSHIKGSINIPRHKIRTLRPHKKIALVCNKGVSAQHVAVELLSHFKDVYIVEGGLSAFFE